jgi:hypothetical protein
MWTWWILGCALRGGVPHTVDLADLAPLGVEGLAGLRDEEHALAVARTQLAGAEGEETRVKTRIEAARARRKQASLEYDVASANLDAAEASRDVWRIGTARGALQDARLRRERAEAAERWQEASAGAARAQTKLAEATVGLRAAELEMARLDLLESADRGRAYARSEFTEQLRDAQARQDAAQQDYDRASEDAIRAYDRWKQLDEGPRGRAPAG